ncbi:MULTISPECIES: AMP-binding protein [unclassified Pseudoclavibacter]|uniref:AMP-binding protein n=1 Tax=unclassified Pseudoclavibacter TaxID=2615177 RepID=UPI001BA58567|nr:AMP-binding protein [Pseudoclavibacter sp. Marseille-Q4354]MBS3178960.1 AMP-binding protein [Pseudoclavibacter sp. Marseille-Q4354]
MTAAPSGGAGLRRLVRVDARDPAAVTAALERALDGGGPAVLPTAGPSQSSRDSATTPRLDADRPDHDVLQRVPGDVVLVIETSGSTAEPKRVMLEESALRASAAATYARFDELFGAPGQPADPTRQWLLTLPASYVAGAQVLMRSIIAGTEPVVLGDEHFTAEGFARAAGELTAERRYVSLVPAQLVRLLDAAEAELGAGPIAGAVARFDAILVGGQALPPALRSRAEELGWNLATSYGSSETSGGSLYNGEPLDGVKVRIRDGEVQLAGPVLCAGYLGDPRRTAEAFVEDDGVRWYRTSDGGRFEIDEATGRERLVVTGRLDNVIVSGGEKVLLDRVEGIVRRLPGLEGAVVVAAPSEQWGQVPALVVETSAWGPDTSQPGAVATLLDARELAADERWRSIREATAAAGRAARPALLVVARSIPLLPSGKPDRRSLEDLVARLAHGGADEA